MRLIVLLASLTVLAAKPALAQAEDGLLFRVFFDWAKPELTRDAQAILDEAAAGYGPHQRIEVVGHTDRSGSATYNLGASRRRAEAVKTYLVAKGIPARVIFVSGYGETRPIVPTEDGVREAQNRRVEVSFGEVDPDESAMISEVLADVPIKLANGGRGGNVLLTKGSGGLALMIRSAGLPPGSHGLHLHAVGRCDGPDFASAGPHWNPANRKHGSKNPEGPHEGDLPNLEVSADGRGSETITVPSGAIDADGAALVIHASPDDYRTDPSGNSGARIACAAFTR